jgi:hypothetical protein
MKKSNQYPASNPREPRHTREIVPGRFPLPEEDSVLSTIHLPPKQHALFDLLAEIAHEKATRRHCKAWSFMMCKALKINPNTQELSGTLIQGLALTNREIVQTWLEKACAQSDFDGMLLEEIYGELLEGLTKCLRQLQVGQSL